VGGGGEGLIIRFQTWMVLMTSMVHLRNWKRQKRKGGEKQVRSQSQWVREHVPLTAGKSRNRLRRGNKETRRLLRGGTYLFNNDHS